MLEADFNVWCDDSNMLSPEELARCTWTEADDKSMAEIVESSLEKFVLSDDVAKIPAKPSDVAKYILKNQGKMSTRKLQKLCYYAQAWHYTWTGERLFKEDFQAWEHGPVCRELFNLHKGKYDIKAEDIDGNPDNLTADQKDSIDIVLEHYGNLTADELVELTHSEEPYKKARGNLPDDVHSGNIISLESMKEYYSKHLI